MKELFYFAFADLMVMVEYGKAANSLGYASHRKMTSAERMMIEQYLLAQIAPRTGYYNKDQSRFIYRGQDAHLVKYLNAEKERNATASVEGLINQSMKHYYSEQIGDAILAIRQELKNGTAQARVVYLRKKMEDLVEAYNHYAEHKISVADAIPSELHPYFGFSTQPCTGVQSPLGDGIN
ncbi:MAG: hypothetical protein ONB44_00780 [candidate division KSB1 bacterium]|nr:hypothetical protein [candidate division KSB1 bacterium]MDZ7300653.1 hypothetical protein [candidate division KSB1 bacterium]MDZ7309790.1 hypothetical protein [candidate division KSB1 bacterium]